MSCPRIGLRGRRRRAPAAVTGLMTLAVLWPAAAAAQVEYRTYVPNDCVPQFRLAWGWCGDGGSAKKALVLQPADLTAWPDGAFAFSSDTIAVIRKVDPRGTIDVAAGNGTAGFGGDGGPARSARISVGVGVAALGDGGLLIADTGNNRVRHVSPGGIIRTVAGTGRAGLAGDGGPAAAAQFNAPTSVAALGGGGFLVADSGNARIRHVTPDGRVRTALVVGRPSSDPARLTVAVPASGGFVVGIDLDRVVRVTADGAVATVHRGAVRGVTTLPDGSPAVLAGGRLRGLEPPRSIVLGRCADRPFVPVPTGDGGPASQAVMRANDALGLHDGSILVSDRIFQRVRRIRPDGRVETVAGGGGLRGRVPQWHTCEGAGRSSPPPWLVFEVLTVRPRRTAVRVRLQTSLRANLRLVVKRGRRTVATDGASVAPGTRVARFRPSRRLRPGRYRFVVKATHVSRDKPPLRRFYGASRRVR